MLSSLRRAPRALAAFALVLALAACAAPPPPPPAPEPPLSYPPSVRARILRILQAEWEDWGRRSIAPDQHRGAPRDEDHPRGRPGPESDPVNFPRVLAYWRAVEEGGPAIARNRARYGTVLAHADAPAAIWGEPAWSAAFISYVMRAAGVDQREFAGSAAHAFYIDAMLADAAAFPATAPFIPRDWYGYAPQPGDLLCADRSGRPLPHWQARLAETGVFRPMHCDIVLRAGPGEVGAVGGNIGDAVTLSRFPADAAGHLLARPAGGPTWFAIFENRLGRLPPWSGSPAW